MLAIVAPGQGAQTPGFLTSWVEDPGVAQHLAELGDAAGVDLVRAGCEADAETIRDTAVAQPLLVGAALATAAALGSPADVLAGHSVGELGAAALAGVVSEADAMRLVGVRGRAMAAAAALTPTSMTAVVGGEPAEVLAAIDAAGLTAANNNGPGQVVAAGTIDQLEVLAANPPRRARLVPLSVAGAFHTHHMQLAVDELRAAAADVATADPHTRLLSNRDGAVVGSRTDAVARIVAQVAHPVRWDLCLAALAAEGVTGLLELAPAGTLTGIAKRHLSGAELFALNTPDQLDAARAFCAAHLGRTPTVEENR